jgi:hypothetical protein
MLALVELAWVRPIILEVLKFLYLSASKNGHLRTGWGTSRTFKRRLLHKWRTRMLSMSGKSCDLGSSSEKRSISASLRTFPYALFVRCSVLLLCISSLSLQQVLSFFHQLWCVSAITIRGHLAHGCKHNPDLQPHVISSGKLGLEQSRVSKAKCPGSCSAH